MALLDVSAALALFAALCFGLQAIVVQRGMRRASSFAAAFVSIVVSMVLFWLVASVQGLPLEELSVATVAPFVVAGVAYPALFRLLYFEGIHRVGPSIAAAVIAGNPAIAALLAIGFLGEGVTPTLVAGIVAIVGGGVLLQVAQGQREDGAEVDRLVRRLQEADTLDLLYPVGALVLYGSATVLIKYGLDGLAHPATAVAITQSSAFVVFVAVIAASGGARDRVRVGDTGALLAFVVAGLFVALAWLGQFFALELGTVVTVMPLVNVYPFIIAVITYAAARELPRSPHVILGILGIVLGATLIQI